MPDSIRQQIMDAIVTRLGLIAPDYQFTLPDGVHTCGSTVAGGYPWRKVPFSKTQVPALALWDTEAETAPGPSTQHEHSLELEIAGYLAGGSSITAARTLMADVTACVGSDPRWGGLARWTDIDSSTVDVEQAGDTIAAVQILCTITYRTPLWRM